MEKIKRAGVNHAARYRFYFMRLICRFGVLCQAFLGLLPINA